MKYQLDSNEKLLLAKLIYQEVQKCVNDGKIERIKIDKDLVNSLLQILVYHYSEILKYIDLDGISFEEIDIRSRDLSGTNAVIDPQLVFGKSLQLSNLSGLDLRGKNFKGVMVRGADLSNTGATININEVYEKDITYANLTGCNIIRTNEKENKSDETDCEKAKKYIMSLFN